MRLREKRGRIKKTPSMVGSKTHKTKSDSEERLGPEVSNADSVVRPASGLSNTGSEAESGSGNEEAEKSGNESIVIMCGAHIGPLCISFCLSTSSEMVNAVTLKLPDVHLSINFLTISWTAKERVVFKIDPNENNCDYSPALLGLQRWVYSVECQVVFPLKTGIYLLARMALGGINVCHYHLKCLCCCLNIVLYLDNQVLRDRLTQV